MKLIVPEHYEALMDLKQTEQAIKNIVGIMETHIKRILKIKILNSI